MDLENEAIEQTQEQQIDATAAATEASESLAAGFNKVRGEPTTEVPLKKEEAAPAQEEQVATPATEDVTAEPEKVEPPIVFAGLTEEQLRERLNKVDQLDAAFEANNRKIFGKFGENVREMKNEIKKLREVAPAQAVKVTADRLKRISAEYGSDLATLFAEDLNEILQAPVAEVKAEVTPDQTGDEQEVDTRQRRIEKRLVEIEHPDCNSVWKSPDWKQWMQGLPPQVQQELGASWDSEFLSKALNAFKSDKAKTEQDAKAAAAKQTTQQRNDKRLANATAPSGTPTTTPATRPDHQGLSDGFNKVRSKF